MLNVILICCLWFEMWYVFIASKYIMKDWGLLADCQWKGSVLTHVTHQRCVGLIYKHIATHQKCIGLIYKHIISCSQRYVHISSWNWESRYDSFCLISEDIIIVLSTQVNPNTVECRYSVVWYNMILNTKLQWPRQNINQSKQRVSIVRFFDKTDRAITAPHCITNSFCVVTQCTLWI